MDIVFDLDGTLACVEHRRHHVTGGNQDWDAFHDACADDEPKWEVIDTLLALVAAGHNVEIWSGRADRVEAVTRDWLASCHMGDVPLQMRPEGDYTPDQDLKRQWLQDAAARGFVPTLVFDDRDKVVAMWREEGIVCAQVAPGNF